MISWLEIDCDILFFSAVEARVTSSSESIADENGVSFGRYPRRTPILSSWIDMSAEHDASFLLMYLLSGYGE